MGSAPCRGHVVLVTDKVIEKLGLTVEALTEKVKENFDPPYLTADGKMPDNIPDLLELLGRDGSSLEINLHDLTGHGEIIEATPFRYNVENGDCYDDLEDGAIYLIFEEEDLYIKQQTVAHDALNSLGLEPEVKQWTNFG